MALATLSIDLEARLASLQQGMDKAVRIAEKESARMTKAFSVAGAALASIGAGVSVTAIARYFSSIIDGVDALNDLADATGASIENISALEQVALRTGTSIDTVGSALVRFNKILSDAKPGSDAAAALEALGLNAAELKRIDPAEALRQTAVALAQFADDGDKARIVQELFGKSVQEAAPFLKDLAEQGALVATVTREQAEAAEAFNKQIFELQTGVINLARDLAGPLVSAINETVAKFKQGAQEGKGFFATLRDEQLKLLGLGPAAAPIAFSDAAGGGRGFINPPLVRPSLGGGTSSAGGGGRSGRRGGAAARAEIGFGITDSAQATKNLFLASEKDYERVDELLQRTQQRAQEAADALRQSVLEQGRAVFAATRTPAEELAAEIDRLNQLLQAGAIDWDTYARAQFAAQDGYDKATAGVKEQAEQTNDIARDLGLTFSSAFEDAIVGGNGLRDVLKGLEQDILRIVTRRLVTEPLGNAITGLIGGASFAGLGGLFSSLFGGAAVGINGGAVLPSILRGGAATGSNYIERDMLTILHKGEAVIPKAYNPAAGGSSTGSVQNTFVLNGPMDSRTQQQIAALTARSVARSSRRYN